MEPSDRGDPSRRIRKKHRRANEDAQDDLIEPDHAGASPQRARGDCSEPDPAGPAALPALALPGLAGAAALPVPPYPLPSSSESDFVGSALPSPPPESGPARPALPSLPTSPDSGPARATLTSPPSLVLNHPPVCADQLLDCGKDVHSASDSSGRHGADNNDGQNSGEGAAVPQHSSSDNIDDDWDGDPFLTDIQGNLTNWRLSDMEAALENHLKDEASKPKVEEKKYSKEEILKRNDDCKKQFMAYALQKYNNGEGLAGEMCFVFDEIEKEVFIVEGGMHDFYEHFNFTAKLAGSTVLFFAEVVPHIDYCDVLCCKPLDYNDNGVVDGFKDSQEMAVDLQGGDVGQHRPFHLLCGGDMQGSMPTDLEVTKAGDFSLEILRGSLPVDSVLGPATPSIDDGAPLALSSIAPLWSSSWARRPTLKELLLPPEETKAKLYEVCDRYASKCV